MNSQVKEEIEKVRQILEILNFSPAEINARMQKLTELILLNISTNLLLEKNYRSKNGKMNFEEIEKFIKENYSPNEVKKIVKESATATIADYFEQILKNVSKEKLAQIEKML